MRDIAASAGMLGGSLYHHFESKEALYLEVHRQVFIWAGDQIERAAAHGSDPWTRLESACTRHLEIQLSPTSPTFPLMTDLPSLTPRLRTALVLQRDKFERIYRDLVAALPLKAGIDRRIYRITLLSLLNTVPAWFRPGGLPIPEIVRQVLTIYGRPARR